MEFKIQGLEGVYSYASKIVSKVNPDGSPIRSDNDDDDTFDYNEYQPVYRFSTGDIELPRPFRQLNAEIEFVHNTYTLDVPVPITYSPKTKFSLETIAKSLPKEKIQFGRKTVFVCDKDGWPEYGFSLEQKSKLLFFAGDKGTLQRVLPSKQDVFEKDILRAAGYLQAALNNIALNQHVDTKLCLGFYKSG